MNILVIGNGFDLAHGLPTKYTDFLAFCKMILNVYLVDYRDTEDNEEMEEIWNELKLKPSYNLASLKEVFYDLNSRRTREEKYDKSDDTYYENITTDTLYDKFHDNIKDNIWIEYFLQCNMYQKENWIDFEREISKVIQSLDEDIGHFELEEQAENLTNNYLKSLFVDDNVTFGFIWKCLLDDLNNLVEALEIYLTEYVECLDMMLG